MSLLSFYCSFVHWVGAVGVELVTSAGFLISVPFVGLGEAISDITILRCFIIEGGDSTVNSFMLILMVVA